jgi:hypothetical protein
MGLVEHLLFEFLVIGQSEFSENGNADQVAGLLNGNHGLTSAVSFVERLIAIPRKNLSPQHRSRTRGPDMGKSGIFL